MAAPRFIQTVSMPTEYERQAAEARRRQALAEALEAQAYQPLSGSAAPTPSAAPLVMALQSFLSARQRRKAEEAGEKAKTADIEGMRELVRQLGPQERTGAETAMEQMRDTAMPGQLSAQGTYTPSQITPMSAPIGMPYTQAAPTGQERQNLLLQAQFGGTPRAGELAKALMAVKPEEFDIKETGVGLMRVGKTTGTAKPITYGGEVLMPRDAYSMGMTPAQKAQYELDVQKYGIDRAQANLARTKAADEGIDVSSVNIPGAIGAPRAAPQAGPPPVRVPSMTPAQMRMDQGTRPAVTGPATPRPAVTPVSAAAAAPTTGETRRVPLIESPQLGAKQRRELLLVKEPARARASSTQSEIQSLVDLANDLKNHPGLPEITGKLGQYSVTDLSPLAREARGLYDTLRMKTSLLKTAMVREANTTGGAFGNMTEQEWPRLESAFGNISNAQDPAGFVTSLNNYINNVNSMGATNLGIYENTYGKLDWKPTPYEPLSKRYQKGKSEQAGGGQSGKWGRADVVAP